MDTQDLLDTSHKHATPAKIPESDPYAFQNPLPSATEIRTRASAELTAIPKVSRILLRISGEMVEVMFVHDYNTASGIIIAASPYTIRFESHFPNIHFERIYMDAGQFNGELFPGFTDVNA